MLIALEKDLWVLMADLATDVENRHKLTPGISQVTEEMVVALEPIIDDLTSRFERPKEFVVPGQTVLRAHLDVAQPWSAEPNVPSLPPLLKVHSWSPI
jgi:cob(I)alamin adenosyltransferase